MNIDGDGTLSNVSAIYTNPYNDKELILDGEYYILTSALYGTGGQDNLLYGNSGNQLWRIEDDEGNQMLYDVNYYTSGNGDDVILLASDNIILGNLNIDAGHGNDIVWSNAGDDNINGQDGDDILSGGAGNDVINGGYDCDILMGDSGNDVLTGGAGNDTLKGGWGNDEYIYNLNDDHDIITETSGIDKITIGEGITLSDLEFNKDFEDLIISVKTGFGGSITITSFYSGNVIHQVEELAFSSDNSTFDLTILLPENIPPVAVDDYFEDKEDGLILGNVLANDYDPDFNNIHSVAATYITAQGVEVKMAEDGAFFYTPPANFNGEDSFTYQMSDGSVIVSANVTLNVKPVNDAPVAIDDHFESKENEVVTGNVLNNDTDIDGDNIYAIAGTYITAQGVELELAQDGSFIYTPPTNFNGEDSFTYQMSDGSIIVSANVTLNVKEGFDNYVYGTNSSDYLYGGDGKDVIYGEDGRDVLYGSDGDDALYGGDGRDYLNGGVGNDIIYGDDGRDYLSGGTGNDVLYGGSGNDLFFDMLGRDTFIIGEGRDRIVSSGIGDTFVYNHVDNQKDTIYGFSLGKNGDTLDLSDILTEYDPLTDDISEFVQVSRSGWFNTTVSVDVDGGGDNFVAIANLLFTRNAGDAEDLIEDGNLIV